MRGDPRDGHSPHRCVPVHVWGSTVSALPLTLTPNPNPNPNPNRWHKSRWPPGSFTVVDPATVHCIDAKVHEQFDLFVRKVSKVCVTEVMKSMDTDLGETSSKKRKNDADLDNTRKRKRLPTIAPSKTMSLTPHQACNPCP